MTKLRKVSTTLGALTSWCACESSPSHAYTHKRKEKSCKLVVSSVLVLWLWWLYCLMGFVSQDFVNGKTFPIFLSSDNSMFTIP